MSGLRKEPDRASRAVFAEVALIVGVALAMTLAIGVASEDRARPPDALAYLIGIAIALLLLGRRRWPLGVLIASIGCLYFYYSFDFAGFAVAIPLAVPSYFAALAGRLVPAVVVLAVFIGMGVVWQWLGEDAPLLEVLGFHTLPDVALLAAVLALGVAIRSRRAWAAEVDARQRRAERDRASEAARRIQEERLRIARELHDAIAHTLAAVNVQAGVAADVLDDSPGQAREALGTIRQQARQAIEELRTSVALVRGDSPEPTLAPTPTLDDLEGLLEFASEAGLEVRASVSGDVRPLPQALELSAFRIVQESLTNVVRHAHASRAAIHLRYDPAALVVEVEDDGRGANGSSTPNGHGLAGMRERAAAVGGTVEAGSRAEGGFRVSAQLPLRAVR